MTWAAVAEQLHLLPNYLSNHLLLTIIALSTGIAVCVPLGFVVTRVQRLQWPTLTVAGVLQTIPGIALLALMVPLLGRIGFLPAVIALILYSFLPILRNTVTGIMEVDTSIKEAARGIGMTDRQSLFRIELPLALPVVIAGIRTAAVWVVGTATLATPVGATSLGNYIFSGLQTQNLAAVVVGCVAAAALAIILDLLIRLIEIAATRRSRALGVTALAALAVLLGVGLAPLAAGGPGASTHRTVVIGSKPFTEQYILAESIARLIERAGFEPDRRSGMGSTILFEALAASEIDCYVDYTGTVWANMMKRDSIPPRAVLLNEMTLWLDSAYGIVNLGALGFENTYTLAVRRETAQEYELTTISDLARCAPNLSVGSDYEFFSRPEWAALRSTYGLRFREQRTFDPSLMYSAIAGKQVDVISAYSTDGRIVDYDLVVLDDPRQALPPYDAVLLLSPEAATEPALTGALRPLIGAINDNTMRRANKLVDVDGLPVDSGAVFLLDHAASPALKKTGTSTP
jgi:osmoprotectant transport system permease protein